MRCAHSSNGSNSVTQLVTIRAGGKARCHPRPSWQLTSVSFFIPSLFLLVRLAHDCREGQKLSTPTMMMMMIVIIIIIISLSLSSFGRDGGYVKQHNGPACESGWRNPSDFFRVATRREKKGKTPVLAGVFVSGGILVFVTLKKEKTKQCVDCFRFCSTTRPGALGAHCA